VNQANEIAALHESAGTTPDTDPTAFVYDAAGNLTSDGRYVYQYDAWNRLIQVNEPGTVASTR